MAVTLGVLFSRRLRNCKGAMCDCSACPEKRAAAFFSCAGSDSFPEILNERCFADGTIYN